MAVVGEKLFFHANYDRVYGVYCYDLAQDQVYRLTDGGYATDPVFDQEEGELYFLGLNTGGYDLYCRQAVFNEYRLPLVEPERWPELSLHGVEITEGGYGENLKTLVPKIMLPFCHEEQGRPRAALVFLGGDAIGHIPQYVLIPGYDFQRQQVEVDTLFQLNLLPPLETDIIYSSGENALFIWRWVIR